MQFNGIEPSFQMGAIGNNRIKSTFNENLVCGIRVSSYQMNSWAKGSPDSGKYTLGGGAEFCANKSKKIPCVNNASSCPNKVSRTKIETMEVVFAQCLQSATIWALGPTRNPYFVIRGASLLFDNSCLYCSPFFYKHGIIILSMSPVCWGFVCVCCPPPLNMNMFTSPFKSQQASTASSTSSAPQSQVRVRVTELVEPVLVL